MNKKNRWYLLLAFVLGLLVIGNEMRTVSWQDITREFFIINWAWILLAVCGMLIHWGIGASIIQLFLRRTNPGFSFKSSYRVPLIEHLFNAITPFSTGGQPAQIIVLSKSGVDMGVATSVSLMKFVVYQVWIVINFLFCLIFGYSYLAKDLPQLGILIVLSFLIHLVVVIVLLMIMYWYTFTQKILDFIFKGIRHVKSGEATERLYDKTTAKMKNFYDESRYMKNQPGLMFKASVLTVLQLIAYYTVPYFILRGLGITDMSVIHVIVLHAFIILFISLFPIPGGIGGAEYSFKLLFGTFIATQSKLVLAIFLWRVVTYYLGIVLGLIALTIKPKPYINPKAQSVDIKSKRKVEAIL